MNKEAIYVHVPWCQRRCPYCDFYIVVGKPNDVFIDTLIQEYEERAPTWLKAKASSLYFGGGTPSMLPAAQITKLIDYLNAKNVLDSHAEITLEANPEDLDECFIKDLSKSLVNRISLGVQSFDDRVLSFLGRAHNSTGAWAAIKQLMDYGFNNISIDLIIGVYDEDIKLILEHIERLHELGIPHVSAYLLTIEENTNFHRRIVQKKMTEPSESNQVYSYKEIQNKLMSLGYIQYDISSYGKSGFFSAHNQIYWGQGSYLGLGPGAHSMKFNNGAIIRAHNDLSLQKWLKAPTSHFLLDELDCASALKESLAFGLRNMHRGVNAHELSLRHQIPLPAGYYAVIEKNRNFGWLEGDSHSIRLSKEGALFADRIMAEILSC